jgi:16S rRNA (cytosine1402-N4)-methyltransferase
METKHIPVMLDEVLVVLKPKAGEFYMDCTLGGAGYTLALAEKAGQNGGVLGSIWMKKP